MIRTNALIVTISRFHFRPLTQVPHPPTHFLARSQVYVIDVAGGDKIPRKGGPGITQSDVLVINKIDIAEAVGADLGVMEHDAGHMRGDGPTVFAEVKHNKGVEEVAELFLRARDAALDLN